MSCPARKIVAHLHEEHAVIRVLHPSGAGEFVFQLPREQWDALAETSAAMQGVTSPLYSGFEAWELPEELEEAAVGRA